MKLLASTVLALASAQGSGDYDYSAPADRNEYVAPAAASYVNSFGNNANTGYNFDFGSRANFDGYALNCWEANWDTDNLINHQPMHIGGSESGTGSERDWLPSNHGWAGGKYQYGHMTNNPTNPGTLTDWTNYASFRHAGCLYESNGWVYNSPNYKSTHTLSWTDNGNGLFVNWFHVFNAHVKPSGYAKAVNSGTFHLVMANPTYEGLGWLNWVATFGDSISTLGPNNQYAEFADSTWTIPTSAAGNNISPLTWTLGTAAGSFGWDFTDGTMANHALGISVSSFPHNSLGKDFRFNIRVLHQIKVCDDAGCATNSYDDPSYFWYKVNKITIDFPFFVGYALHHATRTGSGVTHDGGFVAAGGCAAGTLAHDTGNCGVWDWDGQGLYAQWDATHTHTFNIIPPLDMGNHETAYSPKPRVVNGIIHHTPTGHSMDWVPIVGYLHAETAPGTGIGCDNTIAGCADWCKFKTNADNGLANNMEFECSKRFIIKGLLNSYDESMSKGHRGTHQEIWIQLQYAMGHSPFPYHHFMPSEMAAGSIVPSCDSELVKNQNDCTVPAAFWAHP